MATFAAVVSVLVAVLAAAIAVVSADASRRQAKIAQDQADIAREQADTATVQAEAAWAQVDEARRANEAAEQERRARQALEAVQWSATYDERWGHIRVWNKGTETAREVKGSEYGAEEDWLHGDPPDVVSQDEVHAGDYFTLPGPRPRTVRRVYVHWSGAPRPRAVEVVPDW